MDKPFIKIGFVDCLALLLIYFTTAGSTFFRIDITFPVFIRIYLTGKIKLLSLSNSFVTNVVLQLSGKLF